MKRDFLAELGIDDEKIDKIMAEHGKTVNPLKDKVDNFEQEKENINNEKEELKNQLKERDKQLDELGEKAKNHDDLKEQIDALKQANRDAKDSYEKKLQEQTLEFSLDKALLNANARNPKTVKALLDRDIIKLGEEGELVGLSEQLEKLKEEEGYLFKDEGDNQNINNNINSNFNIGGNRKKSNTPKDINPYEKGRQKALERFKKEEK